MADDYERPDHKDALSMEPKPLKQERQSDDDLLREAQDRALYAASWWEENHARAESSVRFVEGEQYDPAVLAARAGRPSLVLNDLPSYVEQVTGEQRQNRPAIHVVAADDYGAEMTFATRDKTRRRIKGAEVYEGIIRAIEFASGAEQHYDAVHRHAVDGGMGFLRVLTRYANGKDFDQELLIRHVPNRWAVLLDPEAIEPDWSDARFAFIGKRMKRTEFERRFPDALMGEIVALDDNRTHYWGSDDEVTVAEYFTREAVERERVLLSNGQADWLDNIKDVLDELAAGGPELDANGQEVIDPETGMPVMKRPITVVRQRKVITWRVMWRLITAWSVLEGPLETPFETIPIVPVWGRRRDMRDGRVLFSSLIHHAKDPKRLHNHWMSEATERVSNSAKAQWSGPPEAIEGHRAIWQRAHSEHVLYLPINDGYEGKVQRIDPTPMPVAEVQMAAQMQSIVKDAIGMGAPSLGDAGADASGRALRTRQTMQNTGTFTFTDNLSMALRRVGLLLINAIPVVYDTERVMRLRNEDGTSTWVEINTVVKDEQTGREVVVGALGGGEYDVTVTAGPSFATQRMEAGEGMMRMAEVAPSMIEIAGDKLIRNQEWPGADDIADRMRRNIAATAPHLLSPAEMQEIEEEQGGGEGQAPVGPDGQPMPSPEEQAAQQQAEMAQAQQQAAMQVLQAETAAKMAQAEAKKAAAEADMLEATLKMQALQAGGLGALKAQPPTSAPGPVQIGPDTTTTSNGTGAL